MLALAGGCGIGTAAVVVASGGSSSGGNAKPIGSALAAPRSATSPATVSFQLADQEGDPADVRLSYRLQDPPGGPFLPITLAPGSAPLSGVPSNPGVPYEVLWDFAADLGDEGYREGIEVQLEVVGGISPPTLGDVAQGNDAPEVLSAIPLPPGEPEYSGNTDVSFVLADSARDVTRVRIEFNADAAGGFPAGAWTPARPAATPLSQPTPPYALTGLVPEPGGSTFVFRWDTEYDLDGFDAEVLLRFTPEDGFSVGASWQAEPFRVDNNAAPFAALNEGQLIASPDRRRGLAVPIRLFDEESDPLRILVQWRREGQAFPELPHTAAELIDLLDNPARAGERSERQVARATPLSFRGSVGALEGLGPERMRLPELAGRAAQLVALGLGGRTLELLRPKGVFESAAWAPAALDGPVAALPSEDGRSVFVLDRDPAGWRVRQLDLETGAVLQTLAQGPGAPRGAALDRRRARLFVGSETAISVHDLATGALSAAFAHGFAEGPRGLAALGADVVLATGDDALVRFDLTSGEQGTLVAGLSQPWGLAVEPLETASVLVAERGSDRVLRVRLDELVPRELPARVAPDDVPLLGAIALPSPRALTLERSGERLLVVTQRGAQVGLRAVDLRSPFDLDAPPDGRADPYVFEAAADLADPSAAVAAGPDGLRVVARPANGDLSLGGGVSRSREIVAEPTEPGDPAPYDATTQTVLLLEGFDPAPEPGTPWRIRAPCRGTSSPTGITNVFVWNSEDAQGGGRIQLRVLPIDADVGTQGAGSSFKEVLGGFQVEPLKVGATALVGPQAVAAADLDGDGDLDLAAASAGSDEVAIFLQSAVRTYTPLTPSLAAGEGPEDLVIADLDADGDLDLVSANVEGDDLTLFYQESPGSFTPAPGSLPCGDRPLAVAAADLDGDGDVDLVAANADSGDLTLQRQDAPGSFQAQTLALPAGAAPSSVLATDLDGDGDLDLVVADYDRDVLLLLIQGAPGQFALSPATLASGDAPGSLASGDLDGDGRVDLVAGNWGSYDLTLFLQTAPGVFEPLQSTLPVDGRPSFVLAADLDADGDLDLVSGSDSTYGTPGLRLYFQEAPGQFTSLPEPLPTGDAPRGVAAGDLDGDGRVDLVATAASFSGGELVLFLQSAPGQFAAGATLQPGQPIGSGEAVASADLDRDGDLDLVCPSNPFDRLSFFFQEDPGSFTLAASAPPVGDGPAALDAVDLDGDGDLELVCANYLGNDVTLLDQTVPGEFSSVASVATLGRGPVDVAASDLDGDGDVDLITANELSGDLTLLDGSGSLQYTARTIQLQPDARPVAVTAVDLDQDGDQDVVAVEANAERLLLLFQTSPGQFTQIGSPLPVGAGPVEVFAGDLDGDGRADLVCANAGGNDLTLWLQEAPGVFASRSIPVWPGGSPRDVVASDLDEDGDLDLAVVNYGSGNLVVLVQVRPGEFQLGATPLSLSPVRPTKLALGDWDGDSEVDLIAASYFASRLIVLFSGH